MHEDDAFEDDDVFQQYLPHNMDSTENNNHDTEQQVQLQSDGGQGKGKFNATWDYFIHEEKQKRYLWQALWC